MAKGKYKEWLEPDNLIRLEAWARNGLTDEQIANNMGISRTTLYDYKNKYPDIANSLKRGKEVIDIEVENALYKRAVGYAYVEKRVEESAKDGKKIITTIKEIPPDVTAQIFWLKNRKPLEWRDKQDIEHSGSVDNKVVINILDDDLDD